MAALELSNILFYFQNTALFIHWKTDFQDLSSSTEPFLDLFKDSSPSCASKLVESGTSGFLQDKSSLFQSERKPNNLLNKFTTVFCWATTVLPLIIQEINLLKRLETPKWKDSISLVWLVQKKSRRSRLTWERETKKSQLESSVLNLLWRCSQSSSHQRAERDLKLKRNPLRFEMWLMIDDLKFI